MKLENCAPVFQRRIAAISAVAGKDPAEVYGMWRAYSDACSGFDQSALVWEFLQWNADKLGGDLRALEAADEAAQ